MSSFRTLSVIALAMVLLAACSDSSEEDVIKISAEGPYAPNISQTNFSRSTVVDNPYFPLKPGTTSIYEGTEDDDKIRVEEFVTDDTRLIMGVPCVVVRVTEWINGELVEDTLDWYAQDNDGNVWYFGEDSRDYEDGELVGTEGSWEAGVDGAKAGLIMKAEPRVGDAYRQEYYKGETEDMGEVIDLNGSATVPYGSFDGLVVITEWTPLEPGVIEHDYYALGVGPVLEVVVKGGSERLELVEKRGG